MEIELIEKGLNQLLARKIFNYVHQIDKITCSFVNMENKISTTKKQTGQKHGTKSKIETLNMNRVAVTMTVKMIRNTNCQG